MLSRLCKSVLPVIVIGAALAIVADTSSAAATCFGMTPTITAVAGEVTEGTAGPDIIVGTAGPDIIRGKGGDDLICSKGGNDEVYGGRGDDRIKAGAGDDLVVAGPGNDEVLGQKGADQLNGNSGADDLRGGAGRDTISGGRGRDTLAGNNGQDELRGGSSADELYGGKKNDTLFGKKGNDLLQGNSGTDTLRGGAGNDLCFRAGDVLYSCNEPAALSAAADACIDGSWKRCDALKEASHGSDLWLTGATCGGRNRSDINGSCARLHTVANPTSAGDDPYLDALLTLCENEPAACEEMHSWAPSGTVWATEGHTPRQFFAFNSNGIVWSPITAEYDSPETINMRMFRPDSLPVCIIDGYLTEQDTDVGWRCTYERTAENWYRFTLEAIDAGDGSTIFGPRPPAGRVNAIALLLADDLFPIARRQPFTLEGPDETQNFGFPTDPGTVALVSVSEYDPGGADRFGYEVGQRPNGNWFATTSNGNRNSRISGDVVFIEREDWNYACVRDSVDLPWATSGWPRSIDSRIQASDRVDNPLTWTPRTDCPNWPTSPSWYTQGWISVASITAYEDARTGQVAGYNNDPYYDIDAPVIDRNRDHAEFVVRSYSGRPDDANIGAELQYITLGSVNVPTETP